MTFFNNDNPGISIIKNTTEEGIVKNTTENECIVKNTVPEPSHESSREIGKYAYSYLNDHEKAVYDVVYDAIRQFRTRIDAYPPHTTFKEISKVAYYVYCDHPEIFWFEGKFNTNYQLDTDYANYTDFTYSLSADEARACQKEIDAATESFLNGITGDMSDYDVALAVFRNIISLVDYDTLKLETSYKLPHFPHHLRNIYGVFVDKKAVCAGYTKAFQYLVNRLGIECTFVSGKGKTSLHSWNLIRLGGDYYYIDVTWDDHSDTKPSPLNSREITYDYFCVDTKTLLRDHTPDYNVPMPICTAKACNYYHKNGLLLGSFDSLSIQAIFKYYLSKNIYNIQLKATDQTTFDTIIRRLFKEDQIDPILNYLHDEEGFDIVTTRCKYEAVRERLRLIIKLEKS